MPLARVKECVPGGAWRGGLRAVTCWHCVLSRTSCRAAPSPVCARSQSDSSKSSSDRFWTHTWTYFLKQRANRVSAAGLSADVFLMGQSCARRCLPPQPEEPRGLQPLPAPAPLTHKHLHGRCPHSGKTAADCPNTRRWTEAKGKRNCVRGRPGPPTRPQGCTWDTV